MTEIIVTKRTTSDAVDFSDQARGHVLPDLKSLSDITDFVQSNTKDLAGIRDLLLQMVITIQKLNLQIESLKLGS
jgi:hypothetical protein